MQQWKVTERAEFLSLLQQEGRTSFLEIGSGPGRDGKFFQDVDLRVTCIDLSPEMVRLCRRKGLTARVMDATEMDFPDSSFEAVYALNSLLHLSKTELPDVLRKIDAVLTPTGLFYMGVYGGFEHEGVWEEDDYQPKRFFSFFTDDHLKQVVSEVFDVLSFKKVALPGRDNHHFQSLVLRKKSPELV